MTLATHGKPLLHAGPHVAERLGDVALVALQHLLPSIVPLFRRFTESGIPAQQIYVLGKPFSTVPTVPDALANFGCYVHPKDLRQLAIADFAGYFRITARSFWREVCARLPSTVRKVVIHDEGGWLTREAPVGSLAGGNVVGVEHTMYGLFTAPPDGWRFPLVAMAASAAKTRFESPVIADAIVERLSETIRGLTSFPIGIIGLGNVGSAVAGRLGNKGAQRLWGYDVAPDKVHALQAVTHAQTHAALSAQCEVLIGCTGRDTLDPVQALHGIKGTRWMASASSGDIEFNKTLLHLAKRSGLRADPFRDVRGRVGHAEVVLLNGGFPLNFDRVREREHSVHIQLTRELTYASVMQAALCVQSPQSATDCRVMLDPEIQQMLVEAWLQEPSAAAIFPKWMPHGTDWWARKSGGTRLNQRLADFLSTAD